MISTRVMRHPTPHQQKMARYQSFKSVTKIANSFAFAALQDEEATVILEQDDQSGQPVYESEPHVESLPRLVYEVVGTTRLVAVAL